MQANETLGDRVEQVEELLRAARHATGLDDFGEDMFRDGLERLVRAYDSEAHLNTAGQAAIKAILTGFLSTRLQVEDWYRRHPEIDGVELGEPLIGISLPRTGSTALSFLLAEDPYARSLLTWEAQQPCPPPSTVEGPDPRIPVAEREAQQLEDEAPRSKQLVPNSATGPQECQSLMALDFKSHIFQTFGAVPSYAKWLLYDADLVSTYLYERRVLKLLQWGFPAKPWRLKCPTHLIFLDQLHEAFPEARFVMTHRDPTDVVVSVADVCAVHAARFTDEPDLHYLGAVNVEHWSVGMQRALAFRDKHPSIFYDIGFRAMQSNPMAQVRGLYDWLGQPVTAEFESGMKQWWQDNAENRQANVHPDPAAFGIDLEQVRPLFADYTSRLAAYIGR